MSAAVKRPELLAPAGGMEQLKAAVRFGADAVYVGAKKLGLRAFAGNFDESELKEAARYAHMRGVKLYVTVNAFLYDDDMDEAGRTLAAVMEAGADAAIVSDTAAVLLARDCAPGLPIFISTQANTLNSVTAAHYYDLGAKRVILARELSLDRIKTLKRNVPDGLGIECFVHGSMCASYSGRCVLSNYLAQRDANRGECAQPCRWAYNLVEEKRPGQYMPVFEDENGVYIYSARDLCMISHLDKLIEAGIDSFKIEGRMKSDFYVATVVAAYRRAIDFFIENPGGSLPESIENEVSLVSHREFSTGFFFGLPDSPPAEAGYGAGASYMARVLSSDGARAVIEQRNRFFEGDRLEALTPDGVFEVTAEDLRDEAGEKVASAPHPMQKLSIKCGLSLGEGDLLRKRM